MQNEINKPIFIVGSPRSGTSILTWCLGQHPNILVQQESSWIGSFAVDVAIGHEIGSARGGHSQLSALDVRRDDFMAHFGKSINDLILSYRRRLFISSRCAALRDSSQVHEGFRIARSQSDPKSRWVDGTPEYSFYICGLRKLFPGALFIHIVRDVDSVVRSLLNFDRTGGGSRFANEQQAYEKWLRTVECCTQAERAYGSQVVYRLQYSDLINNPEPALRSVLKFLGEPYAAVCLEPLQLRINSSNVPASFDASDPQTDPAVVEKARRLSAELEKDSKHVEPSAIATDEMETAFDQRVRDASQLAEKAKAKDLVILRLQKEFEERTAWALRLKEEVKAKDLVILRLQKQFEERTAWALRLKEEVKAKDLVILRWQKEFGERIAWALACEEDVKAKDLVILSLQKLSRRPVETLKRILSGKSWR
jgi:hypothetical protein